MSWYVVYMVFKRVLIICQNLAPRLDQSSYNPLSPNIKIQIPI